MEGNMMSISQQPGNQGQSLKKHLGKTGTFSIFEIAPHFITASGC